VTEAIQLNESLAQFGVSENLRIIVGLTAGVFERTGEWATINFLADETSEWSPRPVLDEALRMPGFLGGIANGERVWLTGLGLVLAGTAPNASLTMVRLAGICSERRRRLKDEATVSSEILISDYGFPEDEAKRAKALLDLMPGIFGGSQSDGDKWVMSIWRGAHDYSNVRSVRDLLEVLEDKANQLFAIPHKPIEEVPASSQQVRDALKQDEARRQARLRLFFRQRK
jgi:hypothetical protein